MSSLTVHAKMQLVFELQKVIGGGQTLRPRMVLGLPISKSDMIHGTEAYQASKVYGPVTRTLAGGAQEELDLSGSLVDTLGDAVQFTKVKGIYVRNISDTVGANMEIGGSIGTSENVLLFKDATDIKIIGPGGVFFVWEPSLAGITVTAGSADMLRFANVSSPSVGLSYDVVIWGV